MDKSTITRLDADGEEVIGIIEPFNLQDFPSTLERFTLSIKDVYANQVLIRQLGDCWRNHEVVSFDRDGRFMIVDFNLTDDGSGAEINITFKQVL